MKLRYNCIVSFYNGIISRVYSAIKVTHRCEITNELFIVVEKGQTAKWLRKINYVLP